MQFRVNPVIPPLGKMAGEVQLWQLNLPLVTPQLQGRIIKRLAIITPCRACAVRGKVIALGLEYMVYTGFFLGKLPRGGKIKVLGFQGGQSINARSTLSRGVRGHAPPENFDFRYCIWCNLSAK